MLKTLINKAIKTFNIDNRILNWTVDKDTENPEFKTYHSKGVEGDYVVAYQGGYWSWVLMDREDGFPFDLGCNYLTAELAMAAADLHNKTAAERKSA